MVILCGTTLKTDDKDFLCLRNEDQPVHNCCAIKAKAVLIHKGFNLTLYGLGYLVSRLRLPSEEFTIGKMGVSDSVVILRDTESGAYIVQTPHGFDCKIFNCGVGCSHEESEIILLEMFDFIQDTFDEMKWGRLCKDAM